MSIIKEVNVFGVMKAGIGNFRQHTLNFAASLSLFRKVNLYIGKDDFADDVIDYQQKFSGLHYFDSMSGGGRGLNIFLLANNNPHTEIYKHFLKNNGIVVFHDLSLFWLLDGVHSKKYIYQAEFGNSSQSNFMVLNSLCNRLRDLAIHSAYYNKSICDHMLGAIVHSNHGVYAIKSKAGGAKRVSILNLYNNKEMYYDVRGVSQKVKILLCGYMAPYKNVDFVLESLKTINSEFFKKNVTITIAGAWEEKFKKRCMQLLMSLKSSYDVKILDQYLTDEVMILLQKESDVIINLRYPTCGESSGVAAEILNTGKAVLVTDIGSFSELENVIHISLGRGLEDYIRNITAALIKAVNEKVKERNIHNSFLKYGSEINNIVCTYDE